VSRKRGSLKDFCWRGHPLKDAHVSYTEKGIKRTCRKCRAIRNKINPVGHRVPRKRKDHDAEH
jgi:hypothetical protein